MQFKTVLSSGAIAAIALIVSYPLSAQAIPQRSRSACIRSTAAAMGAGILDVAITSVGRVSAESGAVTVMMQNKKTGQTAECRVNTIDNTVLSVTPTSQNKPGKPGNLTAYQSVCRQRVAEEMGVPVRNVSFVRAGSISAESGAGTLFFKDNQSQQGAECRVSTIDGTVLSVNLTGASGGSSDSSESQPEVGTPVGKLSDLVGARAGQAENTLTQRGYQFVKSSPSGDAVYSYWREARTNYCVTIRTANGRYESIVYGLSTSCGR